MSVATGSIVRQPAFLLHRRPYRETSALASFMTPELGRLDAVVRGVYHRKRTQKAAWLQPFQLLNLQWRVPRVEKSLITLSDFEPAGCAVTLQGEALICGLYMNELTWRVLKPQLPAPGLFDSYRVIIAALAQADDRREMGWLLRQYELAVLEVLGVTLDTLQDAQGHPLAPGQTYQWRSEQGWRPASQGISGRCLRLLVERRFDASCLGIWKKLLQGLLRPWLGTQRLQTWQLLRDKQR